LTEGRRPAGYVIADPRNTSIDNPGEWQPIDMVNKIRLRVAEWKQGGYIGVSGVTRKLLDHWHADTGRRYPFFWCQLDAIETLIWLTEAPDTARTGLDLGGDDAVRPRRTVNPSSRQQAVGPDGGPLKRLCTKLCTGGGKTTVMAMLIAWQVCNKVTYPQDKRFSKNVLVVAPGLTVKSRLQVLKPEGTANYYREFDVVPPSLSAQLQQGRVTVINWQALAWDSAESIAKRHGVDKRGPKSDEAYARGILQGWGSAKNILVINDEAHHAWRLNPEYKDKKTNIDKDDQQEATVWVSGLDQTPAASPRLYRLWRTIPPVGGL
jgi:type III restriction enzyme